MKTFSERLAAAVDAKYGQRGGRSRLASEIGVSQALISQWTTGAVPDGSRVQAGTLLAAARTLGVRPEWLALGEGPMRHEPIDSSQAARPEIEKLRAAIEMVESVLEELNIDYPPATKAGIVAAVYAAIEAGGVAAAAKGVVATMLKAVSESVKT